jgi:hypothetical protein
MNVKFSSYTYSSQEVDDLIEDALKEQDKAKKLKRQEAEAELLMAEAEQSILSKRIDRDISDAMSCVAKEKSNKNLIEIAPAQSLEELKKNKIAYLVDIRSEPESIFNGRPDLTEAKKPVINIPYKLYPSMRDNPKFKETYKKYIFNDESTTFIMCRDGTLAEKAVNEIREFHSNCFAIKNGFDGEKDNTRKQRGLINGWKGEGLPWESC